MYMWDSVNFEFSENLDCRKNKLCFGGFVVQQSRQPSYLCAQRGVSQDELPQSG